MKGERLPEADVDLYFDFDLSVHKTWIRYSQIQDNLSIRYDSFIDELK